MTDRSVIAYPAILHFSESRHYIREVSPANTMAYDKYRLVFSRYFTNRYQRKSRLVHFGIIIWWEPPFPKKGGL